MDHEIRFQRKRFKCVKCKMKLSKLVSYDTFQTNCINCNAISQEISEEEFKAKVVDSRPNNQSTTTSNRNNQNTESTRLSSNVNTNTRPSNTNTNNTTNRTNNTTNTTSQNNQQRTTNNTQQRSHSNTTNQRQQSNRSSNVNQGSQNYQPRHHDIFSEIFGGHGQDREENSNFNINNRDFNINNNNSSNVNNSNSSNQNSRGNEGRSPERVYIINNNPNSGNGGFFSFSSNSSGNPFNDSFFRNRLSNLNFVEDIFEPSFLSFNVGNQFFQDNYSSNFPSNFTFNFRDIMEESFRQNQGQQKPPTSKEALKKLKRFNMNEKYCNKTKNNKLEKPSCCVCITDIKMDEDTLLIPCGHMFHYECIMSWLTQNNTCPVCRFELPAEGEGYK